MRLVFALMLAVLLAPANAFASSPSCAPFAHAHVHVGRGEHLTMAHDGDHAPQSSPLVGPHSMALDCCQACSEGQAQSTTAPEPTTISSAAMRRLPANDPAPAGREVPPVHGPTRDPI